MHSNLIATFSNRTSVMQFYEYLKNNLVPCNVINIPNELSKSCGLVVSFSDKYINVALKVLQYMRFQNFKHIFKETKLSNGKKSFIVVK